MDTWLHPIIKKRVTLQHIHNIKLDLSLSRQVRNLKIEPLGIPLTIDIILQDKIILILADPKDSK